MSAVEPGAAPRVRSAAMRLALALTLALAACGGETSTPTPTDAAPADLGMVQPDIPCGGACGAGTVCFAGRCEIVDAGSIPEDRSDANVCPQNFDRCGGTACVDLRETREHCGACGIACPAWSRCAAGRCAREGDAGFCDPGTADCDQNPANECEAILRRDTSNCGACGRQCPEGQPCRDGVCAR